MCKRRCLSNYLPVCCLPAFFAFVPVRQAMKDPLQFHIYKAFLAQDSTLRPFTSLGSSTGGRGTGGGSEDDGAALVGGAGVDLEGGNGGVYVRISAQFGTNTLARVAAASAERWVFALAAAGMSRPTQMHGPAFCCVWHTRTPVHPPPLGARENDNGQRYSCRNLVPKRAGRLG